MNTFKELEQTNYDTISESVTDYMSTLDINTASILADITDVAKIMYNTTSLLINSFVTNTSPELINESNTKYKQQLIFFDAFRKGLEMKVKANKELTMGTVGEMSYKLYIHVLSNYINDKYKFDKEHSRHMSEVLYNINSHVEYDIKMLSLKYLVSVINFGGNWNE